MTEPTLLKILVGNLLFAVVTVWLMRGLDAKGPQPWPRTWENAGFLFGMLVVFDISRLVWPLDGASTLLDISGRNVIITILVAVLAKALDREHRMTWRRTLLGFPVICLLLVVVDVVFLRIPLR